MQILDTTAELFSLLDGLSAEQVFVVTDTNVAQHCLPEVHQCLPEAPVLVLPAGEESKSLSTVEKIWDFLFANNATRNAVIINIGGGVITDMGGFAAATYKRGIRFVNLPTTLLAMVDASSGGKTGVNYHGLKNAIGTFSPPMATWIYLPFLHSLPAQEWLSGFAEMLKHALIAGPQHWQAILAYNIQQSDIQQLKPLLADSLQVKERIVAADPQEHGLRKALNFGHTVGHAIEEAYARQGKPVPHGYCVLWGMVAEMYLNICKLGFPREPLQQLVHLMLEYYGRPACNCKQQEELLALMLQDKKNTTILRPEAQGLQCRINFTLLRTIGEPIVNQTATDTEIREALDYLFSV